MTARSRTGGNKHFTNAQIAHFIELRVGFGFTYKAIAKAFGLTEKAISYYVDRHYYGPCKRRYQVLIKESKINDREDLLICAV